MKKQEILSETFKKSATHHMGLAEKHAALAKSDKAKAAAHTNAILGQCHRDDAETNAQIASHHTDMARHMLDQHANLEASADADLIDSQEDAGDVLRSRRTIDLAKLIGD